MPREASGLTSLKAVPSRLPTVLPRGVVVPITTGGRLGVEVVDNTGAALTYSTKSTQALDRPETKSTSMLSVPTVIAAELVPVKLPPDADTIYWPAGTLSAHPPAVSELVEKVPVGPVAVTVMPPSPSVTLNRRLALLSLKTTPVRNGPAS